MTMEAQRVDAGDRIRLKLWAITMSRKRFVFALVSLVTLVVLSMLYTWHLDQVPPYLNQDEAGLGLGSYLLATTGRDYFGNFLPPYIQYFEHHELGNAMLCYWAIPTIAALGLSPVSIRLAMVESAVIALLLFGYLSWQITKNRWIALVSVLMLASCPLFFIQSRIFMEPILTVPFVIGWMICLAKFERSRDSKYVVMASIILGIGAYAYSISRMLMPMYLVLTLLVLRISGQISWGTVLKAVALFALCLIPMALFAFQNAELFSTRFRDISWLTRGGVTPKEPLNVFVAHYLAQFDPIDLFVTGDRTPFHSTGRAGVFLWSTTPLAVVGVGALSWQLYRYRSWFVFVLLAAFLLFPSPTALLVEIHEPYRSAHMIPLYLVFCVVGLQTIVRVGQRRTSVMVALTGIAVLSIMEAVPFFQDYFTDYPKRVTAADYFNGNKPLAFRSIMEIAGNEFYFDCEDSLDPTFAQYFKVSYGYRGATRAIQPRDKDLVPVGSLLLTRRQDKYLDLFTEETTIPEIAESFRGHYSIMRRIDALP